MTPPILPLYRLGSRLTRHALPMTSLIFLGVLLWVFTPLAEAQSPTSVSVFELTQEWKYNQTENLDGTRWRAVDFDDSAWESGPGLLYSETNEMVMPRNTQLTLGRNTYYFRTHFTLASTPDGLALLFSSFVDDGAVFYLNGGEIQRLRIPPAPAVIKYVDFATSVPPVASDAVEPDLFIIAGTVLTNLVVGDNVLAVEVHQATLDSSDIVFGSSLSAIVDPSIRWAVRAGGTSLDEARGVGLDGLGNGYVVGTFAGTASFGPTNLVSRGSSDAFLAKYDSTGKLIWGQQVGGTGSDSGSGVAVDVQGNAYVTGPFAGTITLGGSTLTGASSAQSNHFIAKFDSAGGVAWAKQGGGSSSRITVDADGNSYVAGQFSRAAAFGALSLTGTNALNVSVAKYDPAGNVLWAQAMGGNKTPITAGSQSIGIASDPSGNCFVTTSFNTPATFGGTTTLTNKTLDDIFLARYTSKGALAWVRQITGGVRNQEHGVAADANGNAYVVANFQKTADLGTVTLSSGTGFGLLLAKYDKEGILLWAQQASGTNNARGIALDAAGNAYVAGQFSGTAVFGEVTLTSLGAEDVFVAKYASDGSFVWVRRLGGTTADMGLGIAADAEGNVLVTGSFFTTAVFGGNSLTSRASADAFVARIGAEVASRPTLDIVVDGTAVVLSWPKSAEGFRLESTANLSQLSWNPVVIATIEVGGRIQVSVPNTDATQFFRLSK